MASIENEPFTPALSEILQRCGLSPDNFPDTGISPEDKVRFAVCAQQLAWWLAMQREQRSPPTHGVASLQGVSPAAFKPSAGFASQHDSGSCLTSRLSWKRLWTAASVPGADNCRP